MNNHLIPKNVRIRKKDLVWMEARAMHYALGKATTREQHLERHVTSKAEAREVLASLDALRRYLTA